MCSEGKIEGADKFGGAVIISYMLEIYLGKIGQTDQFDYADVRKYDMVSSAEIMKNLSVFPNKEEVLVKDFERCPYNQDIYKELIDIDKVDYSTFEIAKYLGQSAILFTFVKEYAEKNVKSGQDATGAIKIWASYVGTDEKDIYKQVYSQPYTIAMNGDRGIVRAINDSSACVHWTSNNIANKSSSLISKNHRFLRWLILLLNEFSISIHTIS